MTLTPAYGRDYKSRNAVLTDFHNNKDFKAVGYGYDSRLINKEQVPNGTSIQFRYNNLLSTFIHKHTTTIREDTSL